MGRQSYTRRWLDQTIKESKAYWLYGVLLIIVAGFFGFIFLWIVLGRNLAINEAILWVIWTLGPAVVTGILFLIVNFLRAPAKLAADDNQKFSKEINGVREEKTVLEQQIDKLSGQPELVL